MKRSQLFILAMVLVIGCEKEENKIDLEFTTLIDGTSPMIPKPSFDQIREFLQLKDDDGGILFKGQIIGDVDYSFAVEKKLPSVIDFDETPEDRYLRKQKFLDDVEIEYNNICRRSIEKKHSIVYRTIAKELNRLAKSKAIRKIALTNSDLIENSDIISFYTKQGQDLLLTNPRKVKELLLSQERLVNLKGLLVIFSFIPQDFEQNMKYRAIVEIYKEIIVQAGGGCQIGLF